MATIENFEPKMIVSDPLVASALIAKDISYIKGDISDIKDSIKDFSSVFVTREEFIPVRNIAYSLVAMLGAALVAAIVKVLFLN